MVIANNGSLQKQSLVKLLQVIFLSYIYAAWYIDCHTHI